MLVRVPMRPVMVAAPAVPPPRPPPHVRLDPNGLPAVPVRALRNDLRLQVIPDDLRDERALPSRPGSGEQHVGPAGALVVLLGVFADAAGLRMPHLKEPDRQIAVIGGADEPRVDRIRV